jgi:hypothetical protein
VIGRHLLTGAAITALLAAPSADASTFHVFGYTGRSIGMGGALTAGAGDFTALFYNPAALTLDPRINLGVGVTVLVPDLYVDREGAGPPAVASSLPEVNSGIQLGWRYPLGGVFEKKVALGLGVYLPIARIIHVQGVDPARPQWPA